MKITSKPMRLRLDAQTSLRSAVRDLLQQAESRQKRDLDKRYLDIVLYHLVGATIELILGHEIEALGAFVDDGVADRAGDYAVEDYVIYVTTFPTEALLRKCGENIAKGLRPLIITIYRKVPFAEGLAENAGIAANVEIFDVEQFLASNILELSRFKSSSQWLTVAYLVKSYNRLASCENNPGLLIRDK